MKRALPTSKIAASITLCLLFLAPHANAAESLSPAAMTDEKTPPPAIVATLEKATDGLQMLSETDAPFKVVFFALEADEKAEEKVEKTEKEAKTELETEKKSPDKLSPEKLAQLAGAPDNAKIETRDLDDFFAESAKIEDWMNTDEKATAQRFAALLEILKTQLKQTQVLVWGDAEKHVAILGKVENGLAGVTTSIVET